MGFVNPLSGFVMSSLPIMLTSSKIDHGLTKNPRFV